MLIALPVIALIFVFLWIVHGFPIAMPSACENTWNGRVLEDISRCHGRYGLDMESRAFGRLKKLESAEATNEEMRCDPKWADRWEHVNCADYGLPASWSCRYCAFEHSGEIHRHLVGIGPHGAEGAAFRAVNHQLATNPSAYDKP